jgi:hypothetical protein
MGTSTRLLFPTLILGVILLAALLFVTFDDWAYRAQRQQGQTLITQIEAFQASMGRLPTEAEGMALMQALGWTVSERCPCYRTVDEDEYLVWFGARLGASYVYHSATKSWRIEE